MIGVRSKGRPIDLAEGEMRERLLRSSALLFAERGYVATSVQAIVDSAGTTKPMVYYYFQNKEGLYRALIDEAFGRIRRKLEAIDVMPGNIDQALRAVVEANFELYRESPEIARFSLAPLLGPDHGVPDVDVRALGTLNYRFVRQIVTMGISQGKLTGNADAIALALVGQIVIYQTAQLMNPEIPVLRQQTAQHMVDLLLNGARVRL